MASSSSSSSSRVGRRESADAAKFWLAVFVSSSCVGSSSKDGCARLFFGVGGARLPGSVGRLGLFLLFPVVSCFRIDTHTQSEIGRVGWTFRFTAYLMQIQCMQPRLDNFGPPLLLSFLRIFEVRGLWTCTNRHLCFVKVGEICVADAMLCVAG
jgi:hypothetical protein